MAPRLPRVLRARRRRRAQRKRQAVTCRDAMWGRRRVPEAAEESRPGAAGSREIRTLSPDSRFADRAGYRRRFAWRRETSPRVGRRTACVFVTASVRKDRPGLRDRSCPCPYTRVLAGRLATRGEPAD